MRWECRDHRPNLTDREPGRPDSSLVLSADPPARLSWPNPGPHVVTTILCGHSGSSRETPTNCRDSRQFMSSIVSGCRSRRGLSQRSSTALYRPRSETLRTSGELGAWGQQLKTRDFVEDTVVGHQRNPQTNCCCRDPEVTNVIFGGERMPGLPAVGPELRTYADGSLVGLHYYITPQATFQSTATEFTPSGIDGAEAKLHRGLERDEHSRMADDFVVDSTRGRRSFV